MGWLLERGGRTGVCCYGYSRTAYISLAGAQESPHALCPLVGLPQPQTYTEVAQYQAAVTNFTQLILNLLHITKMYVLKGASQIVV